MWQLHPQNASLLFNLLFFADFCLYLSNKGTVCEWNKKAFDVPIVKDIDTAPCKI